MNCPSAGKTEMCTRFSTDANPLSPESISVLVPRHQLCQPLPGIFFSKAYEKPMNSLCIFFLNFLHQVSHDQVMCVFLQCHLSVPDQCNNTKSVKTHILCYINRARWAWSFGYLKRILFLSSTPTLYTEMRHFLHDHFSTPVFTKTDKRLC